jgi:uncharacterized protein (DUF983 family)
VAEPSPLAAAVGGLCPRCGARTLFSGTVRFADRCSACGLDFTRYNVGDEPAALLTLVLGAVVVGLAVTIQLAWGPPLWVQMLIWIPVTAAGVVLALRIAKAALMALEYRHRAGEGRLRDSE